MFKGIDPIAQIILAISIGFSFILILLIVYIRGVRAGKIGLTIPGKNKNDILGLKTSELETVIDIIFQSLQDIVELNEFRRLERKMIYVEEKLVIIRGMKEKLFYKLLKESGVNQDHLTDHVDSIHFVQVLNNALYSSNGEISLKSLFRQVLKGDEYKDFREMSQRENQIRYGDFIDSFFKSSVQKWKRFFYNNYKTNFIDEKGQPIQRKITNEDVYEMDFLKDHLTELKKIFRDIFDNARLIDERIDSEKEELYESRKSNIRKILAIK
jgi:hypothetical protein